MAVAGFLATTLGKIVAGVLALVLAGGAAVGGLYLADYGVEATIVDKSCNAVGSSSITLQPKVFPTEITQPAPFDQCSAIQRGNFVIYNVQSERVRVFTEEGGKLLWDSARTAAVGGGGLFSTAL